MLAKFSIFLFYFNFIYLSIFCEHNGRQLTHAASALDNLKPGSIGRTPRSDGHTFWQGNVTEWLMSCLSCQPEVTWCLYNAYISGQNSKCLEIQKHRNLWKHCFEHFDTRRKKIFWVAYYSINMGFKKKLKPERCRGVSYLYLSGLRLPIICVVEDKKQLQNCLYLLT